jgi:hypothetical protein
MEAVVTSLSLPPGSRLGFGVMVRINGDDYILAFGPEQSGKNNFNNEFDSIYYRSLNPIDEKKMDWFVKKLEETIDINQTYFMCSNSSVVKKKLLESKIKIKLFRDLDNHDLHHVPNGFVYLGQSIDDAIFAVTELIILSRGKHIYYSGEVNNISLFNWYAINIKKVKLINI